MKKIGYFFIGAVFSAIIFTGTSIFANSETTSIMFSPWIKYIFNGKEQILPDDYSTIIYNGHTYVPARFVAQELGAKVSWNEENKTIRIDKEEPTAVGGQESNTQETKVQYESLPLSKTINGVSAEVYDIWQYDGYTKIYLRIKNTNKVPFQFDQESAKLKLNNVVLINKDVDDKILNKKDKSWYDDITEDQTQAGYVVLPEITDIDEKEGTLTFNVIQNDKDQKETQFSFDIKW